MSTATAILIFAQPAAHEAARKCFAHQSLINSQVIQQLNKRTRLIAGATLLPVVQSTALITHTGTFGNQLDRACRATFALGFDRILVIGNDCPALTTTHLIEAANRLERAPVVLGPDHRGGIYLLGLSRAAFERISLIRLPWQTSQLAQAVRRLYADQPILLLPRLGDINGRVDLQQYGLTTPAAALFVAGLLALASGTSSARSGYPPLIRPGRVYLVGNSSLRAPPALYATGRAA